jgi:TrmH family RNA methyltransferase
MSFEEKTESIEPVAQPIKSAPTGRVIQKKFEGTFGRHSDRERPSPWMRGPKSFRAPPKNEEADDGLPPPRPAYFHNSQALATDKGREKEGRFLAEGVRVVEEMVAHHSDLVDDVYVAADFRNAELLDRVEAAGLTLHKLPVRDFQKLCTTTTSPGIFAVCRSANVRINYDTAKLITLVDAVQDPGNLGSLFRTALGFGADGLILGNGTVSPFNPKVVRGSSGTFLRMPFETGFDLMERLPYLRSKGFCVIAASPHAKRTIADIPKGRLHKVALLVGAEGAGVQQKHSALAEEWVRIPMANGLESLNVAVAHGILSYQLSEAFKQN